MSENLRVSIDKKINTDVFLSIIIIDDTGVLELPKLDKSKKGKRKRIHIICERLYEEHRGNKGIVFLETNGSTFAIFQNDAVIELEWQNEWKIVLIES